MECDECGMRATESETICPKCDAALTADRPEGILHRDISHARETVDEALRKLARAIDDAEDEGWRRLRLVVGRGAIREEVQLRLGALKRSGRVRSVSHDGRNDGALIVRLS